MELELQEMLNQDSAQVRVPELGLQLMGLNLDSGNRHFPYFDPLPRQSITRSHGNLGLELRHHCLSRPDLGDR